MIVLGTQQDGGGGLNFCIRGTPTRGSGGGGGVVGGGRFEHPSLAEVVPNCLVAFFPRRVVGHILLPHTHTGNQVSSMRTGNHVGPF